MDTNLPFKKKEINIKSFNKLKKSNNNLTYPKNIAFNIFLYRILYYYFYTDITQKKSLYILTLF